MARRMACWRRPNRVWLCGVIAVLPMSLCLAQPAADTAPADPPPAGADSSVPVDSYPSWASPRDAMFTFLTAINDALNQREYRNRKRARQIVWQCFDFEPLDPGDDVDEYEQVRLRIAERLLDVLDRIGEVRQDELPNAEQAGQWQLERFIYFPRREPAHKAVLVKLGRSIEQRIELVPVEPGTWKFSRRTIAELNDLSQTMMSLPPAYTPFKPEIITGLGPTFTKTPYWGWLALLVSIFIGLVAGKFVSLIFRGAGKRAKKRGGDARAMALDNTASPVSLALLTVGLMIGLQFLWRESELDEFLDIIIYFLFVVALAWLLFNLVDLIELAMIKLTARTETKLDDMVVPLVRKTLRIFLVIVFTMFTAQNVFGLNITGWLAGLGIAGLAVSLAAQDSVKNLFGSITIFFDKPFLVGDFIDYDSEVGTVEEIGFRSTRIRLLSGHLVTVPNMKFTDSKVENISARPYIRRQMDVTITYDTPLDKIEQAVQILKDILNDPAVVEQGRFNMDDNPPRVAFNELNADSLNIRGYYWYQMAGDPDRGFFTFLEHAQFVNMMLFHRYADAGIEFAFPTQTLYLAGDPARELNVQARIVGGGAVPAS